MLSIIAIAIELFSIPNLLNMNMIPPSSATIINTSALANTGIFLPIVSFSATINTPTKDNAKNNNPTIILQIQLVRQTDMLSIYLQ